MESTPNPSPVERLPVQMPMWTDGERALPTPYVRSALFRPGAPSEPRQHFEDALVEAADGAEIRYTGEELRPNDEQVLEEILHMARGAQSADGHIKVEFSGLEMLRRLGRGTNSREYMSLRQSINRLQVGRIAFSKVVKRRRRKFQGQLISAFGLESDGERQNADRWVVWLGAYVTQLFGDTLLLDSAQRKALRRPVSYWLHGYLSFVAPGHAYEVHEDEVYRTSGTKAGRKRAARETLRAALADLVKIGFLADWSLINGTLRVVRAGSPATLTAPIYTLEKSNGNAVVGVDLVDFKEAA